MKLKGNVILITGGTKGIGLELARKLSQNNKVIVCARKVKGLKKKFTAITFYKCDLTKKRDIRALASKCKNVNVLVNNAAVMHMYDVLNVKIPPFYLNGGL